MNLDFEYVKPGTDAPLVWRISESPHMVVLDSADYSSGAKCLHIQSLKDAGEDAFTVATLGLPAERYTGSHLTLRGDVRTRKVKKGVAGLWIRVDGPDAMLAFDNMADEALSGTRSWRTVEVSADVPAEATQILFGVYFVGAGQAWYDHLSFLIDGTPIKDIVPEYLME